VQPPDLSHLQPLGGDCPHCGEKVAFSWTCPDDSGGSVDHHINRYFANDKGMWVIGQCPSCKGCTLIWITLDEKGKVSTRILPHPSPQPADKRIPDRARNDFDEARLCHSVGAHRACAVMCRRAIQTAVLDQGAKAGKLADQIDELTKEGILTKNVGDWAHTVRFIGNDAAHPEGPKVTEEDARDILDLAEEIMNILYVMPSIAKAQRHRPQ